jgi:tRNA-splicing ligase RtcB
MRSTITPLFTILNGGGDMILGAWCNDIEEGAMEQINNLDYHPAIKYIAIMPDCHQGYGMPIGGVIACKNAVIPNAVGVDIGCGMIAVRSHARVEEATTEVVERIMHSVGRDVPVGFDHRREPVPEQEISDLDPPVNGVVYENIDKARYQLGTLGGGNHFIELQAGDDGYVWLMIHSGSRNVGYRIANHYNELAGRLNVTWHSHVPHRDLCFLPISDPAGMMYIKAMQFAQRFAMKNREIMMMYFKRAMMHELDCGFSEEINVHHNFAALEHHKGKDYWVHRKGATRAREGELGIIPGSMGTSSYIVRGKGNANSLESCSHGAGRRMGRGEFTRTTTVEEANKSIEGVVFKGWGKKRRGGLDWSEAPGAYKDIDEVMAQQEDLVRITVRLRPLGVLKG